MPCSLRWPFCAVSLGSLILLLSPTTSGPRSSGTRRKVHQKIAARSAGTNRESARPNRSVRRCTPGRRSPMNPPSARKRCRAPPLGSSPAAATRPQASRPAGHSLSPILAKWRGHGVLRESKVGTTIIQDGCTDVYRRSVLSWRRRRPSPLLPPRLAALDRRRCASTRWRWWWWTTAPRATHTLVRRRGGDARAGQGGGALGHRGARPPGDRRRAPRQPAPPRPRLRRRMNQWSDHVLRKARQRRALTTSTQSRS